MFFFFSCENLNRSEKRKKKAESNETVLLSQLLEPDADAEAQRRFICAQTEQIFEF